VGREEKEIDGVVEPEEEAEAVVDATTEVAMAASVGLADAEAVRFKGPGCWRLPFEGASESERCVAASDSAGWECVSI
jgi:hypothetical protein